MQNNSFNKLSVFNNRVDFSSDDCIGFSKSEIIFKAIHAYFLDNEIFQNPETSLRFISDKHSLSQITEAFISQFHGAESALIFNSGYAANSSFFGSIPQRNDVILYDELSHASIRDGIVASEAHSYSFHHNDFEDLEHLILKFPRTKIYIVTEAVFSMDGDSPNLEELVTLSEKYNCYLVVDETHTLGVFGENGEGLIQYLQLQSKVFARIITFEKGLGCQGAVVLGSLELKEYLISFINSSATEGNLYLQDIVRIFVSYQQLEIEKQTIQKLRQNIVSFNQQINLLGLKPMFVRSKSAIQSAIVPGKEKVIHLTKKLQDRGFDVKPILFPMVPEGQERLRFCIHSYNSEEHIIKVLELLGEFVFCN